MNLSDHRFLVFGCIGDPVPMPLDPRGSLRSMSEDAASDRLRRTLERHTEDETSYARVRSKDENGRPTASIQAFSNQSRWLAGSAAAATALDTFGVGATLALLQGSPAEVRDASHYLAKKLAPEVSDEPLAPQARVTRHVSRGAAARPKPHTP